MKGPQAIYLRDYKAPPFAIDTIDLTLDIYTDRTEVKSVMRVLRQADSTHLELMGEGMTLKKILVDGVELKSPDFSLARDRIVLHNITQSVVQVEIHNTIDPFTNTALEGFYLSGNILCTQCEPEGFRKITYFIDRPDVMAKYSTTLIADKKTYPQLLSNGNKIEFGDLAGGRHFVKWSDPHRKPSYLFAAVAGDLDLSCDTFITRSGRKVSLEVYVDKGQASKTGHALYSLKNSMKWDEETFGLEYDLDIYMIVAVESFNFGAMENKGLNIFNSALVLADPKTATDSSFQSIEAVVAHEYFHNWSGNRVTCRDWFQLTLKEGLTVFRDQEFSSDMLSRAVKRIEDVKRLKEFQFPEDAGPMSHPIRPSSYIEINNFYTATVYEKGAEIIRMIHTLIGDKAFKQGLTLYFNRHDGQAVTTDDFVRCMEEKSGKDLSQFKNWYSRPGTPSVKISMEHIPQSGELKIKLEQKYPSVLNERLENNVLLIPFKMAFYDSKGSEVGQEKIVELTELTQTLTLTGFKERPTPSWNRSFAAPIIVDYAYSDSELYHLMSFDTDPVSRYEATQKIYHKTLNGWITHLKLNKPLPTELEAPLKKALSEILQDASLDASFVAHLFDMPSESQVNQQLEVASIDEAHKACQHLKFLVGSTFYADWKRLYETYQEARVGDVSAQAMGARALKNCALAMMVKSKNPEALVVLDKFYAQAQTMTEEAQALALFCSLPSYASSAPAIAAFYKKWKHEPLVMLHWFALQSSYADKLSILEQLEVNRCFRTQVPNDLRGLYQSFARHNLTLFHHTDGSGYRFLAERIKRIDGFNPQLAARLVSSFSLMPKMDGERKKLMKEALKAIVEAQPSKDVFEVASRYLGQA